MKAAEGELDWGPLHEISQAKLELTDEDLARFGKESDPTRVISC